MSFKIRTYWLEWAEKASREAGYVINETLKAYLARSSNAGFPVKQRRRQSEGMGQIVGGKGQSMPRDLR